MESKLSKKINKNNKYYNEEKIDLFYDYSNNFNYKNNSNKENKEIHYSNTDYYSKIDNNYENYSINNNYYSSDKCYNEDSSSVINIKSVFNSNTLKDYIKNKKEIFNKISNSMNNIINKHKKEEDKYNFLYKFENHKLDNKNNDENLNKIVDHLIKAYSKDELKLIKEKINKKVDEDEEEPIPEKLSFIKKENNTNKLKVSSDSPLFLRNTNNNNIGHYNNNNKLKNNTINKSNDKIKKQYFKKINKNFKYKPVKINCSNISNIKSTKNKITNISNDNNNYSNEINSKFKPEFYTYIKCKTSFECLDNFLKRQKSYNNYITNKKINLRNIRNISENKQLTFKPNTSFTSSSKYSIKLKAQRLDESYIDKANRLIYESIEKKKENNKNLKLKYNQSFSFTPNINKQNKIYNKKSIKRSKTKKNESYNKKEISKDLTPIKYVNHKFDYVKSIYKNDNELFKRIKEQSEKKIKKYEKLKIENDIEKMEGCTFKPDMSKTYHKNLSYSKNKNTKKRVDIKNNDNQNKNFTYTDFYQYKKNKQKINKKYFENINNKDIRKVGSLTPIIISKKLKDINSQNKRKDKNDNFLALHKLVLDSNIK